MSARAQHTPGPWRTARSRDRLNSHDIGIARDGVQTVFAECFAEFWKKGDVRPGECEANANLIAAAPDLLAACERAVSALAANGAPNCEAAKECRAAITKARGTT